MSRIVMKKILIIEDDKDITEAIELLLSTRGYNPLIMAEIKNVFKKIVKEKPDLIILDYLLSGSDGCRICTEIKKNKRTKQIPVIMVSAHPSAKKSMIECGANAFLAKPFAVNDLLDQIKKFIG